MNLDQNNLIALLTILSVAIIVIISLTLNTDTKLDLRFGENKSLTIEGKRSPPKTNDCLPSEESSHSLNCDNR